MVTERVTIIERMTSIQVQTMDLEEAMAALAFGRILKAEYAEFGIDPPASLEENLKLLRREVQNRHRDRIEKQIREAEARLRTLETAEEKRSRLTAEIEALKQKLV